VEIRGRRAVNFGSCSYLGLETDMRLKLAACEAVERYGTVFSSSRAYLSVPLFVEVEVLMSEIVGGYPVVVVPNTSLGHQAALPVLVGERDAVCFDVMVHSSVQAVLPMLKQRGVHCEPVPHNRIDVLERRARRLALVHDRVFFLCDGVYSMHGDLAPVEPLFELLDRMPSLFAYVDDAHGVGWAGKHGAGVVLGERGLHSRMAVALGLSKSFAGGGAVLVLPNHELAQRVFTCGGPLIFSGPLQPPQLGALIASAQIHLSSEIAELQRSLRTRIELFDDLCGVAGLQPILRSRSPIRFIEVGDDELCARIAGELLSAGFYVNASVFPAVSRGGAGIRLMLTCQQTLDDVAGLVKALVRCLNARTVASAAFCPPPAPVIP
jgi:7-keto-8-aminopelargonate synthetase-like enzyme